MPESHGRTNESPASGFHLFEIKRDMNRIYQGKVTQVEINNPDDNAPPDRLWLQLDHWEDKLWQHHELFQDAVNYYTVCLLALASSDANPLTKIRRRIEDTAATPEHEYHVWTQVRRKGTKRVGLRDSVAKYLTPENKLSTPSDCFAAVLKGNETDKEILDLALLLLLSKTNGDSSIQKNGNSYAPRFYRPSNNPKWDFSASSVEAGSGRAAFFDALRTETKDRDAIAQKYGLEIVVSLQPGAAMLSGDSARQRLKESANWMLRAAAGKNPKSEKHPLNKAQMWLAEQSGAVPIIQESLSLIDNLEVQIPPNRGGNINLDQLHGFTVFKYIPSLRSLAAGFLRAVMPQQKDTATTVDEPDQEEDESNLTGLVRERSVRLGDDPIKVSRGNRGYVFQAFTALPRWAKSQGKSHAALLERFDIAAFKYALTTLHQIETKGDERKKKKAEVDKRLRAMRDADAWAKWKGATESEREDRPPLLADDPRIARLETVLTSLPVVQDLCDVEGQAPVYGLLPRTIRGFEELSQRWNKKTEIKEAITPPAVIRDKVLIPELNSFHKENAETVGSVALFRSLADPDNWIVWRTPDAATQAQWAAAGLADDPLEALTEERELQAESKRLEEPIRFTPADPVYSRRQFFFSDAASFPGREYSHEPNALCATVPLVIPDAEGKLAPTRVRMTYSAPRLLRDGLRSKEKESLGKQPWSQPMMEALGLKQEAAQEFTDCAIALMPEQVADGERRFLLNFPLTLNPLEIQRAVFKAAEREALFSSRFDPRAKKQVFASYWQQQCAGMDKKLFYLRWPSNKWPAGKEADAWYHKLEGFQCLSVDLGQRDAGAWALLEAKDSAGFGPTRKGSAVPSRQIGDAGGKIWYAAVRATAMFKLPGEDASVLRARTALDDSNSDDTETGPALREEFHGERGRSATTEEWKEAHEICERLGFDPVAVLGRKEDGKSYPQLNDDLLFVLRRAQSRLARWHRWSWMVQDDARQKEVIGEIREAKDTPKTWSDAASQIPVLVEAIKSEILMLRNNLCRELEVVANRILPLRGRKWEWATREDQRACRVLRETAYGTDTTNKMLRGQRGLSLRRIQQLAELRRRCQSLNRALQHTPGERSRDGSSRRGVELPDPCPDLLVKMDHIKEQRVDQLAHDILAQGLGLQLRVHRRNEKERREQDRHGEYERIPGRRPVDFIVIEDLEFYATTQRRSKNENAKLMMWSRRELRKKLIELCETYGMPVIETSPDYTSKFDSRAGGPGFRATEITPDSKNEPRWRKMLERWKRHLDGENISDTKSVREHQRVALLFRLLDLANQGRRSPDKRNPWRTLYAPQRGGTLFIAAAGNSGPVQADINAAINLGLRAIAAPDSHAIHSRVRLEREETAYRPRRKSKREEARWKEVPRKAAFTFAEPPPTDLRDAFFDVMNLARYDHCQLSDVSGSFAGGRGFWDTVNKLEWKRCMQLNVSRLRKWGVELPLDCEGTSEATKNEDDDVPY
jgi:IS605 OrfB family transposase